MDRHIAAMDGVHDGDLMLCMDSGVAYQREMTNLVPYDADYFDKCAGYEGKEIARAINASRRALVARHFGTGPVLDVGVGSGEFIKSRPDTFGYDVNPAAIEWLRAAGKWQEYFGLFRAFTFWDVLEHVPVPADYFQRMPRWAYLFTSLPVFADLESIRQSKHYRPNEHLYYFTERGFIDWMAGHGFEHLETTDQETAAGRESILSFAFRLSMRSVAKAA